MLDINEIVGPLQIDSFRDVIKNRNAELRTQGKGQTYKDVRRIVTNVNQPFATTDVAQSIAVPYTVNVARRVAADLRDSNPLYRQKGSDGGLQQDIAGPGNILRGYYGVMAVFRFLAQTPAQRLDSMQSLDAAILQVTKSETVEARLFGPQFMDWGPAAGADGAAAATSLVLPTLDRKCCPIRPGIIFGADEIPQIDFMHRRTAAWGAAFELDFYLLGLESRVAA